MSEVAINKYLYFFLLAGFLMSVIIYLVHKLNKSEKKKKELLNKFSELEEKVNTINIEKIESELNPHLFKNILNTIQSHAYQTYYALDKLAHVLDYILYESKNKYVTLKEEIEFSLNLIEMNKIKLSPLFDLKVKTKISDNEPFFEQKLIAPLITVDLIENAFKHADFQSTDSFISITYELKDNIFSFTVANKISPKGAINFEEKGIGIQNFNQRLKIIYKDDFQLNRFTENEVYIAQLKIDLLEYKTKMLSAGR